MAAAATAAASATITQVQGFMGLGGGGEDTANSEFVRSCAIVT